MAQMSKTAGLFFTNISYLCRNQIYDMLENDMKWFTSGFLEKNSVVDDQLMKCCVNVGKCEEEVFYVVKTN